MSIDMKLRIRGNSIRYVSAGKLAECRESGSIETLVGCRSDNRMTVYYYPHRIAFMAAGHARADVTPP